MIMFTNYLAQGLMHGKHLIVISAGISIILIMPVQLKETTGVLM